MVLIFNKNPSKIDSRQTSLEYPIRLLDMRTIVLARKLDVPRTRIERLIKGETSMTVDTAARLARFFSTSPQYWMNMQTNYDLAHALPNVESITPLELVS